MSESKDLTQKAQDMLNADGVRKKAEEEVAPKCRNIVVTILCLSEEDIKDESKFVDDLDVDSLDAVEILMEIEDRFDVRIDDREVEVIKTFNDLVKIVAGKL